MADLGSLLGAAGIGGTIGKAIVQLELDTGKYATELKAAEGKTVTATNSMGTSTSKFGSLASTAFLAAGAAAVAGLGMSVKAALEAQEAQEKLHNTIQNAPQLAASSEKAFLDLAESIRSTTGADDEAIISGEALLGQMGLTEDQIVALTPKVVDLAEKSGIDLNSAFKAVGKAAQGSTGALARYLGPIEAGATKGETYANVLEKLGGAAGFAASQAKNEPWRLLQSDLEEISEDIGTALLPAIKSLADSLHNLVPLLETVAKGIQYLPLIQMSEDIGSADNALEKLTNAMIDSIPVLGHFVDLKLGEPPAELADSLADAATKIPGFVDGLKHSTDSTKLLRTTIHSFAGMTGKDLDEWSAKQKEAFDSFVLSLSESAEQTKITRKEFVDATHVMSREADALNTALKRISKEKWVNEDYIAFLSEQGPQWLIGFADLTEREQRRAQDAWEESTRKTDKAKQSLDRITGVLSDLDKGTTRHTVEVHYKYVGFDPTKPGMANAQNAGGQQGP